MIAIPEWLEFILRWVHVITAIAWIGSSFFFVWLDLSLRREPKTPDHAMGDVWLVHGGGFYLSRKFFNPPDDMSSTFHWLKYESYFTWISGFALLAILYYWGAENYLIDPEIADLTPMQAILWSMGVLFGGYIAYDLMCRSTIGKNTIVLALALLVMITLVSALLLELFAARAAFLHAGAFVATIMTGNVFFIIIPNQKKIVAALKTDAEPDPHWGKQAKQRSTHNNYLTLPVIALMISNHYPILYGGSAGYVVVALIVIMGAAIRHYYNLKHTGASQRQLMWQWPAAGFLLVMTIVFAHIQSGDAGRVEGPISTAQVLALSQKHCVSCHAAVPSDTTYSAAPGGIILEDESEIERHAAKIYQQVVTGRIMPLGNTTAMSALERAQIAKWYQDQ
ncbi:MAG: urate hydroxylase PuuD [Pseudomonadota bacterium]